MNDIEKTAIETKKAWSDNWKDTRIEKILEIFDYPRVKKFFDIIRPSLPRTGTILEAGCGLGPWVIKLGMLGYDIVGVDYQGDCINKIKEYDKTLRAYTADIRKMPFKDNSFSAYLSWGVVEHFPEGPEAALEEAHRVLEENGRIILTVPFNNILCKIKAPIIWIKRNPLVRKLFNKPQRTYYYQRYFKVKDLQDVMTKIGFVIEKTVPVDHIFSLIEFSDIFRRKKSYDGENNFAVLGGRFLERFLPWQGAGSTLIIGRKRKKD